MSKRTVMKVNSDVLNACTSFLTNQGFVWCPTPVIVPASGACESVATLFHVKSPDNTWWNKGQAFLAQTGQLHLERVLLHHEKVFCIGPSCRAEQRIDGRHLTEFTLLEIEMCGDFAALQGLISKMFYDIGGRLINQYNEDFIIHRLSSLQEICTLTYSNALEKYLTRKIIVDGKGIEYGDDIHSKAEQILTDVNNKPVLLTKFPNNQHPMNKEIEIEKFFNMKPNPEDGGKTVLSCDLILPKAGECLGGAERVFDVELLKERLEKSQMFATMNKLGIKESGFKTYLDDMGNFGKMIGPHCGFGLGIPRLVQYLCDLETIEETVCFPSTRKELL